MLAIALLIMNSCSKVKATSEAEVKAQPEEIVIGENDGRYVKIDTKSNEESKTCPTTKSQYKFGEMLVNELRDIGMQNVSIDENGYVMAYLPSNVDKVIETIGFIAHMDTAPDFSGENVNPQIVENYNGVVPNDRDYLESLPGVGRKTCNVVLSNLFNEE